MTIYNINAATLRQWRENGESTLVDVREPEEWNAGHIEGASHVPLATVSPLTIPPAPGRKIVIYCRSGRRSLTACEILASQGRSEDFYNLEGGILAWEASFAK